MYPRERTVISTSEMVTAMARDYTAAMLRHPVILTMLGIVTGVALILLVTLPDRGLATLGGSLLAIPVIVYAAIRAGGQMWFNRWFPPGSPVTFALRPEGFVLASAYSTTLRDYDRLQSVTVRGEATILTLTGMRQENVIVPSILVTPEELQILTSHLRALGR